MTMTDPEKWLYGESDPFALAAEIVSPSRLKDFKLLPHQIPPDDLKQLRKLAWMMMGGRGTGKTHGGAKYVHDHVHGPPCLPEVPGGHWIGIVGPTIGDAVTSCVNGPSGLRLHDPGIKIRNVPGGIIARWSNGCEAKLFGAHTPDDVERFRSGGNRCLIWAEELAAWRYLVECWDQIRYGLRVGPHPHAVITTTPKSRKLIVDLVKSDDITITHGTTDDNPYLDAGTKKRLYEDYGGTRMGRQELLGELLTDVEGALWLAQWIDEWRIPYDDVEYDMILREVGVDPSVTSGEGADETGIIVAGMSYSLAEPGILFPESTHGFILDDLSGQMTPTEWAQRAVYAYHNFDCSRVVAEVNNGGDLVVNAIKVIDPSVPVKKVFASRGKAKRAEPVANLYSQGRVHHCGVFPKLEEQQLTWNAYDPDPAWSPDRMDAAVWVLSDMMVESSLIGMNTPRDKRLKNRR